MKRSFAWAALGLAVAVVVTLVVAAAQSSRRSGPPLDPRSTAPDGTRALVLLAERFGVVVDLRDGAATPTGGVALLLEDRLAPHDRTRLTDWARSGGTIVVTDPGSSLAPEVAGPLRSGVDLQRGACAAGLAARTVRGLTWAFEVGRDAEGCFGGGGGAALVVEPLGRGSVVAVGGADPFTNAQLARADNAGLALELLGAGQGSPGPVTVVGASPVGEGEDGLWDLVPTGVRLGLLQGLVALALFVWASAPRLGQPVPEPRLRELPASALTAAVGELYRRGHQRDAAAAILRRRLRRASAARLVGTPGPGPADGGAAGDGPIGSDAELVELARAAQHVPPGGGRP